jgi:tetratricopeptide (TPR) repeat protein
LGALALLVPVLLALTACEPPGARALRRGERLLREDRPAAAIEPLRQAVVALGTNAPAAALAWNELGLAYHRSGRSADAAQAYANALARDFNLFAARYNRGCLFLEAGNLPAAIAELTTYTTHQPQATEAWMKLGNAQLRARQFEVSDHSFQQVLHLNATPAQHAEALNNLGLSQALRRHPHEAFQFFNAALKVVPNYPPALLNQAVVAQQQLNDRALAAEKYRAYRETAPAAGNTAVLDALIRQMEPPPRVALGPTNPPPAVAASGNTLVRTAVPPAALAASAPPVTAPSNPPVVAATRPAPPVKPAPTSAPPVVTPPPPRVETKPVVVPAAPEPPVQVVTLPAEPELKQARDILPPTKPVANPTNPPPTNAASPAAPPPLVVVREPLRPVPAPKPEKRSLVQRINPLHWFGGKSKAPKPVDEDVLAPVAPTNAPEVAPTVPAPVTPVAEAPAPPKPQFPRYRYLSPSAPPAGDRAAAAPAYAEGMEAQRQGNLAEAERAYRRAVALAPDYFEAWFNLGMVAHETSDWPQALAADEQALAMKPADANARYNFALALARAGYPLDAAAELEKLLAANPAFAEAHLSLAGICADPLGERARAREHYLKVLELDPRHPQAAEIRRWLATNR